MENTMEKIIFYHQMYLGCLMGMFISLLIALLLYIWLDMGSVIRFFCGSQKRYKIQEFSFRLEREIMLVHTEERI